jgi:hypothetical protein
VIDTIKVRESAVQKIRELASETSNPEGQMLRLSFAGYS